MKKIYIMVSQTHTKVARVIRKLGRTKYNHVAISLDSKLNELYAFARPHKNGIFLARLVKENIPRYTLKKNDFVNVIIYEIEVTDKQYNWIAGVIEQVYSDKEYMYNLLSMVTFPISRGFSLYKSFTCIEFIMYILKGIDYPLARPLCRYKPDDLVGLLHDSLYFKGNLLDYKPAKNSENDDDNEYFVTPISYTVIKGSAVAIKEIFARIFFKHRTKYQT